MNGKMFIWILSTVLLATFVSAEAQQQSKKIPRIGYLGAASASADAPRAEAFRQGLRELGYIEGQNIIIEYRYEERAFERLPDMAAELVSLKIDVLVTVTTNAALAAKNATRTIPIVFLGVTDPVAAGLVDSLAHPGGNRTGITNMASVLTGKRLELMKETIPRVSRVAVLWDPQAPGSAPQWEESQVAARELGLQLHSMATSSANDIEGAFREATKARSKALAVTLNPVANSNQKRIADLATKNRLPAIYPRGDWVANGGLMSYGPDQAEPFKRVASMVDKILKGAKPADIPVEQPTKFELVINLKTAKQIGLTIPPNVLVRAEKVIK